MTDPSPDSRKTPSTGGSIFLYGAVVFLSSAVVMVLEIAAGRLIAPYVGVSLYSWTSIIGVVLGGLSLGNWAGGVWVDAGAGERQAGLALAASALATLGVLLVLTVLAPAVQSGPVGLMTASFVLALGLFFLPAACLGLVAPMLTTLALARDPRAGHVVGRMHALAALGSIGGTLVTGFVLIQYLGTRTVIVGAGLGLLMLSLPLLRGSRGPAAAAVAAAALITIVAYLRQGTTNPCDTESQYYCIRVVDFAGATEPGDTRTLVLDHLVHGIGHGPDGTLLFAPYAHLMDELLRQHLGPAAARARYFFAGGGSYSQPRAIRTAFPEATVVVAELDPEVTRVAAEQMFVDTKGMKVMHTDARIALETAPPSSFDAIVGDVFHDVAIPYHLTTREYVSLVRSRLSPHGLYVLNVVDGFPDPLLTKSIVKTLEEQFPRVDVWVDHIPAAGGRVTYVVSASDGPEPPMELEAANGFARSWLRITEPLMNTGTPESTLPVLTDDFVPVERLVSRLLTGVSGN